MKAGNAIEVKNLKKCFKVYYDKGSMLKERMINMKRNKYEERWVLNGISFDIKKGEAVGLIGHNGCGKSTTLKLLTRIMYPTKGSVEICGRVSSLLELGAGFHPDISGRENIYINASIFGLSRKEIDNRIKDIIAFSELEEFIDNPVRTYSSGMYMRLAFSVAINVNADVLLIDEILAVGDVNFQAKCFNKLMEIKKKGTTIVLVSHSTDQIEQVCDRSIWIDKGLIKMDGTPREVHRKYLSYMGEKRKELSEAREEEVQQKENIPEEQVEDVVSENVEMPVEEANGVINENEHHRGTGEARIISIKTYNEKNEETKVFSSEEAITFKIKYEVYKRVENALIGLSIFRMDGVRAYGSNTRVDGIPNFILEKNGVMELTFPCSGLLQGKYYVDACLATGIADMVDYFDTTAEFEVYNIAEDIGMIRMSHTWKRIDY